MDSLIKSTSSVLKGIDSAYIRSQIRLPGNPSFLFLWRTEGWLLARVAMQIRIADLRRRWILSFGQSVWKGSRGLSIRLHVYKQIELTDDVRLVLVVKVLIMLTL